MQDWASDAAPQSLDCCAQPLSVAAPSTSVPARL